MSVQNIFLIGPPAAGKTTIGKLLAQALKFEFYDIDNIIEERAGVELAWIYDVEGEDGYRLRESRIIDEYSQRQGVLLSTGGGAVLSSAVRRWLAARGAVVYLQADIDEQLLRMQRDKRRPMLQTANKRSTLEDMARERDPLYMEIADITIVSGGRSQRAVVGEIIEKINTLDVLS